MYPINYRYIQMTTNTKKQTETLTIKLTALSLIANRLFDNKDIELFKKESLAIMATNPTREVIRIIAKGLYPNDHKRVQAFELSTVYCNWLDSNGTRAKDFASYLESTSTIDKIRLLSIEELAVKKAAFVKANKAKKALIEKEKQDKLAKLQAEVSGTSTQDVVVSTSPSGVVITQDMVDIEKQAEKDFKAGKIVANTSKNDIEQPVKVALKPDLKIGDASQKKVDASLNSLTKYLSLPELLKLAQEINAYVERETK
jgi:hypothetical protein